MFDQADRPAPLFSFRGQYNAVLSIPKRTNFDKSARS
jgi:hypothetical protein